MVDQLIPRGDAASENAWFIEHHARALRAARMIAQMLCVLDGAQTVAHAATDGRMAAHAVKYEIDAGVHTELHAFRTDCLDDVDVAQTPRLGALWAMLTATQGFIAENVQALILVRQSSAALLDDLRIRLRTTSDLFDQIIGDCVGDVVALAVTVES